MNIHVWLYLTTKPLKHLLYCAEALIYIKVPINHFILFHVGRGITCMDSLFGKKFQQVPVNYQCVT